MTTMFAYIVLLLFYLSCFVGSEAAVEDAKYYSCPDGDTIFADQCALIIPSNTTVFLSKSSDNELLTLSRITNGDEVVSLGRSYDGSDWQRVAGLYDTLRYNCQILSNFCLVTIPEASSPNQTFSLFRYRHTLSRKDRLARFLEQVTFGTRLAELENLLNISHEVSSGLEETYKVWLTEQIYHVSPTLHREYFRSRLLPRYPNYRQPAREGRMSSPCQAGARWRRASFTLRDIYKDILITKTDSGRYSMSMDGHLRTIVDEISFLSNETVFEYTTPEKFQMCAILRTETFSKLGFMYANKCTRLRHPPIDIEGMDPPPEIIFESLDPSLFTTKMDNNNTKVELMLTSNLSSTYPDLCAKTELESYYSVPSFARLTNGQVLIFDPVLQLENNSLREPLPDGGGLNTFITDQTSQCANAPRTFLNDGECRLSQIACTANDGLSDLSLELNEGNLKQLYIKTGRLLYVTKGLRLGEKEDQDYLQLPCEEGAKSRWIQMADNNCKQNVKSETAKIFTSRFSFDKNPYMADIYFPEGGKCDRKDKNIMEMIILSDGKCWMNIHPHQLNVYDFTFWASGDQGSHPGGSYPIKKFAETDDYYQLTFPGWHEMWRWYENQNQKVPLIGRFGDSVKFIDLPNELKIDVEEIFGLFSGGEETAAATIVCGSPGEVANDHLLVEGFDELARSGVDEENTGFFHRFWYRQRKQVWTEIALEAPDQLRQRVAWALAQLFAISPDIFGDTLTTEMFVTYYDIFTRNAFNTYKQVLKEVAYSPLMAEMLTYYQSKSTEYIWDEQNEIRFADENFAREVMQLFTIGTERINQDGTLSLIKTPVYDNEDIIEYSRAWTGFERQELRGNIEDHEYQNSIDPMKIQIEWRDRYPKMGLDGQYVGDHYMKCSDLPSQAFLRKDATFRLLGKNKESQSQYSYRDIDGNILVHILDPSSELSMALCEIDKGKCTFPPMVQITTDLNCNGIECELDIIQVVQIHDVYYEYVKPPCINFPFFNGGKVVMKQLSDGSQIKCGCVDETHQNKPYFGHLRFTEQSCNVVAIVDRDGKVAVERENTFEYASLTYFRVHWKNNLFPHPQNNNCGDGLCELDQDKCRCNVSEESVMKFALPPSRDDVLSQLFIGAPPLEMIDYSNFVSMTVQSVNIYFKFEYDEDAFFEVIDDFGRRRFLKNQSSNIRIHSSSGHMSDDFQFRNPPVFFNAIPELRDAEYETDAVLDHYIFHKNTAPFVSLRFIQRFGISNPSPRFLKTVSLAFISGFYPDANNAMYGSGNYGDLAATIAAIILDRESRREILDADPMHGSIREPLIRLISLMRNLEYKHTWRIAGESFISIADVETKIGQMAFEMPDIFSFFLPNYSPSGKISLASLNSPEGRFMHRIPGLINGMVSLVKYGLTSCDEGFGDAWCYELKKEEGNFANSAGYLSFSFSSPGNTTFVVDQIATILTSGRMSEKNRELLRNAYEAKQNRKKALRYIEQLAITTPEFHATGLARQEGKLRPIPGVNKKTCKPYKAVVHLLLYGGMDSFNLLVPHSGCVKNGGYNEYRQTRGKAALQLSELLEINATESSQPCDTYGIHYRMPKLKELYEKGEASFIAGIGVLTELATKDNYRSKTVTQLFAHDKMREEIKRMDPFHNSRNTGILGRMTDVLHKKDFKVNSFAIDTDLIALQGRESGIVRKGANSETGFTPYYGEKSEVRHINSGGDFNNNVFTETVSSSIVDAAFANEQLNYAQLNGTAKMKEKRISDIPMERKFQQITKMIGSQECRGVDRDVFHVEDFQYDFHKSLHYGLEEKFIELDTAIESFVSELKNQNMWKNVTIVVTSDFGRTLTPNSSGGTDHGWAGHTFIMGGSVVGGKIFGDYPANLQKGNPLDVGRGRLVPTRPFESMWSPVAQWLGIGEKDGLDEVLLNSKKFPSSVLLEKDDLFHPSSDNDSKVCEDEGTPISCESSSLNTTAPTGTLSVTPSGSPSILLSSPPSSVPTVSYSIAPSGSPSILLSSLPSIVPTVSLTEAPSGSTTLSCPSAGIFPDEYTLSARLGKTRYCYRIQLRVHGKLFVDTNDAGCADFKKGSPFNGRVYSKYIRTEPGGIAMYEGTWNGSIELLQDKSLIEARLGVTAEGNANTFAMVLVVPDCGALPICNEIIPAEYTLPARFGKSNNCYRIEVRDGGRLLVDTKDPGCTEFSGGNRFRGVSVSNYQRTDPGGIVIYQGKWDGSIELKRNPSLSEGKLELTGNTSAKTFSGILTVPTCKKM